MNKLKAPYHRSSEVFANFKDFMRDSPLFLSGRAKIKNVRFYKADLSINRGLNLFPVMFAAEDFYESAVRITVPLATKYHYLASCKDDKGRFRCSQPASSDQRVTTEENKEGQWVITYDQWVQDNNLLEAKSLLKIQHAKTRWSQVVTKVTEEKKYGIIRIYIGFTNLNFTLTTLTGKVLGWTSGGSLENQTRSTRLSSRAVGLLLNDFLASLKTSSISFVKVLFTGPSKRFRSKLFSIIKRKAKRLKFNVVCKEEGFRLSFNGCRLTRAKR
jgi:ribosomal protein S11